MTAPVRIKETEVILAASGVWTVNEVPYPKVAGAEVTVGLGPLKRYGGDRI